MDHPSPALALASFTGSSAAFAAAVAALAPHDGDTPLVIISANATCGCTRPKYPTDPVKPGGKGVIKVTYLPKGRPGEFEKTVKVRTNSKKNKKVVLKISGVVVP